MSEWQRSDSGLVLPKPPPEPPPRRDEEYILVCPRCHGPAEIGLENESRYTFSCRCGGGKVHVMPGFQPRSDGVKSIEWNTPGPLPGTRPEPWKGY